MKKFLLLWGTTLLAFLGIAWSSPSAVNAASQEKVVVNIYKYLNTRDETENETTKIPICEAEFSAFDLTDEFYQSGMDQKSFTASFTSLTQVELKKRIQAHHYPIVSADNNEATTILTDQSGKATWNVESVRNGKAAVYLFTEVGELDKQNSVETFSQPIVLFLPVIDKATGHEMSELDIYPKPISYSSIPYFFKYGKKQIGTEFRLSGATFVLSRMRNGEKEYWAARQPTNLLISHWVKSKAPLQDNDVRKFVSDDAGLVSLGNYLLPIGEYEFEELETVSGYLISPEAEHIQVQVKGDPATRTIDTIVLNGETLEKNALGNVSEKIVRAGRPKIYNLEKKQAIAEPPEEKPDSQNKPFETVRSEGELLKTGEITKDMLILGVGFILLAAALWLHKKHQFDMND